MKKAIIILLLLNFRFGYSQTKSEIDNLLIEISRTRNSTEIIKASQTQKILKYGENVLPILSCFFTDTKKTDVYSDCMKRKLSKGEIAIILADHIKRMPYFTLTGIQNCTISYCENNPNFIEYYFHIIGNEKLESFRKKYDDWLKSSRKKSKNKIKK